MKIVYLIINQLKPGFTSVDIPEQGPMVHIELSELINLSDSKVNIRGVRRELLRLGGRVITPVMKDDKARIISSGLKMIWPFESAEFSKDGRRLDITINRQAVPYFMELQHGYTKYPIKIAFKLKTTYGQKLYLLMAQWKGLKGKKRSFKPEDLMMMMGAENYTYKDFKRDRLLPAIDEVNELTDLYIKLGDPEKRGMKVVKLEFSISSRGQEGISLMEEKTSIGKPILQCDLFSTPEIQRDAWLILIDDYKFNPEQQDRILEYEFGRDEVIRIDKYIKSLKGTKKEKRNPTGYMWVCLNKVGIIR